MFVPLFWSAAVRAAPSNSEKIIEKLAEEISAKGLDQEVNVVRTGCFGLCALGPTAIVYPEGARSS